MFIRFNSRSIHIKLFKHYSALILIFALFLLFFVNYYILSVLEERYYASMHTLSISVSKNMDDEIRKLDNYSLCIQYSNIIKSYFSNHISNSNVSKTASNQLIMQEQDDVRGIIEVLTTVIGPNLGVSQVNLYDFLGEVISVGVYSQKRNDNVQEKAWFDKAIKMSGQRIISLPEVDKFLNDILHKQKKFISLRRVYFDAYNQKQGIIELKQDCDILFSSVDTLTSKGQLETSIYVYNENDQLVYPYKTSSNLNYMEIINVNSPNKGYLTARAPDSNEKEVVAFNKSDYTGWTVVVVLPKSVLLSPIAPIIRFGLIVTAFVLLLTLTVSYFMAKQLTVPIKKIHSQIKGFDLTYLSNTTRQSLDSNIDELEELNDAFQNMHFKLKQSIMDMLTIQERELQSKLLALQSQMNPHFLHNTLANICMMAEENMNKEIVKMCKNISHMLRYISSDRLNFVELKTEIEYTKKYLECMTIRYNDSLKYYIDIPEDMLDIQVPKLIIQPLVENSLKYGIHVEPPWVIEINGCKKGNIWILNIKDNGSGFSESKYLEIKNKLDNFNNMPNQTDMELGGLGIVNIYARLKIFYKDKAVFEINNQPKGGALITIGGEVQRPMSTFEHKDG